MRDWEKIKDDPYLVERYVKYLEKESKVRDCFHINSFTAQMMKKAFLVYGEDYDISHIELGVAPDRWVKIVFGRHIPECSAGEASDSPKQSTIEAK